ncbi:hypothetical protein HWI79_1013 [Cryptosporidium felis]|nr:hypothetical protein HWI79_1013 [Cryptosporidium felis]
MKQSFSELLRESSQSLLDDHPLEIAKVWKTPLVPTESPSLGHQVKSDYQGENERLVQKKGMPSQQMTELLIEK